MLTLRPGQARGHFDHGWLDTYHTFSFAGYYDPDHMGFRSLRVINEDQVAPGTGFGLHPHRDMEILTYVLSGALEHKDSLGHGAVIRPGEVQYMAAGTGIRHSEFNPSSSEPVHLMQIWIEPHSAGLPPRYDQRHFPALADTGRLVLLASPDGRAGSITINQDAYLWAGALAAGQEVTQPLSPQRHAWVQVLRGAVEVQGQTLRAGDGAALTEEAALTLRATENAEVLVFDLA